LILCKKENEDERENPQNFVRDKKLNLNSIAKAI